MAGLSRAGEGNTYFAENYRDLPKIFDSEMGDTTSVIAQNATVEIECFEGFKPKRFLGREGKIIGNKAIFGVPQLFLGQEKFGLLELDYSARDQGEFVIVKICDKGPGLPLDRVDALFKPFERGDKSLVSEKSGFGLGLSIARGLATEMGGFLNYRNEAGGACFEIGLNARR